MQQAPSEAQAIREGSRWSKQGRNLGRAPPGRPRPRQLEGAQIQNKSEGSWEERAPLTPPPTHHILGPPPFSRQVVPQKELSCLPARVAAIVALKPGVPAAGRHTNSSELR